ncbi:MAG: DUF177 domain-containing protein [Prevotellaceae bacterium]|jgi:uncharacterized metal-binding protein YceD (DUF177 family)|nr:DUF177 domain-containing protein [Prevotellaceae bacterium]
MTKFSLYNIYLKDLLQTSQEFDFELNNEFFKKIDSPEVERGSIKATVEARRKSQSFELKISLNGYVIVSCTRCLDDMRQLITHHETLMVKFGEEFGEEDDTVIVPGTDGYINLAWFFYEMIVVNIPIKHIHAAGECNNAMRQKLKKHSVRSLNDDDENDDNDDFDSDMLDSDERETDPRWDKLKSVANNDE